MEGRGLDMSDITVRTEALQVLTSEEAAYYRLLPYDVDAEGRLLCLGEECRDYADAIRDLDILFGKEIAVRYIPVEDLSRLLAIHYRQAGMRSKAAVSDVIEDVPSLIEEAYRMRASDIHMEPSEHRCRIRFRVDGKLLERHVIRKSSYTSMVNRIKIMSNLDISEKRLPQDGRIIYAGSGVRFDIRTSILPTIYGEKIVLRLLTMNDRHLSLSELGLDERQYKDYLAAVSHPHGMILISGPTGSGKSTTLYATLELLNRGDNNIEQFGYDSLGRQTSMDRRPIAYSDNGNITSIGYVGSMEYGASDKPYQITALNPEYSDLVPSRVQNVSYTCYSRPSILTEGGKSAAFTYNGNGDRVKMYVTKDFDHLLTRYYIGGRYEYDLGPDGEKERLYLGGDAYSAPMVLQREYDREWNLYNIGRDYLGNITHITTLDGTPVAEYSYDPWGRLRDPETLETYAAGEEPELFLGRGFTGHEHLTWFGLINMNARLYDPLLGRFLSPDPYIQAPDFTQNFNRYSYALNNPLKFTDDDGEYLHIVIGALLGGISGLVANWDNCDGIWEYLSAFGIGAAAGAAVAATGGAAAAAEGGFWATASVVAVGTAGGAANGATSELIKQTGKNFDGINDVDWNSVGKSAVASGVAGGVGTGVGIAMSGTSFPITINGTTIDSPVVSSFFVGALASGAGHIAGGTTAGLLWGNNLSDAFLNSFNGIGSSMLIGGAFSAASTAAYDIVNDIETKLSEHAKVRIKEREVSLKNIKDALDNPLNIKDIKYDSNGNPSVTYVGTKATVVVNPETGRIITVWRTSSRIQQQF